MDDDEPSRKPKRRMADFSVEVELLSLIVDRIAELIHVTARSRSAPKITFVPRPETALERVQRRHREANRKATHRKLKSMLMPGAPDDL